MQHIKNLAEEVKGHSLVNDPPLRAAVSSCVISCVHGCFSNGILISLLDPPINEKLWRKLSNTTGVCVLIA